MNNFVKSTNALSSALARAAMAINSSLATKTREFMQSGNTYNLKAGYVRDERGQHRPCMFVNGDAIAYEYISNFVDTRSSIIHLAESFIESVDQEHREETVRLNDLADLSDTVRKRIESRYSSW